MVNNVIHMIVFANQVSVFPRRQRLVTGGESRDEVPVRLATSFLVRPPRHLLEAENGTAMGIISRKRL